MQELCAYERIVSVTIQSGRWDQETSSHVASCIYCGELIRSAQWTQSLASEPEWPPLRDSDLVWIEARLFNAQMKRNRSLKEFVVLESANVALLSACAALIVINRGKFSVISSVIRAWINKLGDVGPLTTNLFSTASTWSLLPLLLVAVTFLIYPLLLEE